MAPAAKVNATKPDKASKKIMIIRIVIKTKTKIVQTRRYMALVRLGIKIVIKRNII